MICSKKNMRESQRILLHQVITFCISILLLFLRCDFHTLWLADACCNASLETYLKLNAMRST
jgi:hypothetical protein